MRERSNLQNPPPISLRMSVKIWSLAGSALACVHVSKILSAGLQTPYIRRDVTISLYFCLSLPRLVAQGGRIIPHDTRKIPKRIIY